MTTNTDLFLELARMIPYNPASKLEWVIRGDVSSDEVENDKSLIAVMHLLSLYEVVKGNFTMQLDCALSGLVIIGTATTSEIKKEVEVLFYSVMAWLKELHYTPVLDAIVIEGKHNGNLETGIEGLYYTFTIPFRLIVLY